MEKLLISIMVVLMAVGVLAIVDCIINPPKHVVVNGVKHYCEDNASYTVTETSHVMLMPVYNGTSMTYMPTSSIITTKVYDTVNVCE